MTPFYGLVSGGREGKFYRVIVIQGNTSWGHLVKAVEQTLGMDPLCFSTKLHPHTELRMNFLENNNNNNNIPLVDVCDLRGTMRCLLFRLTQELEDYFYYSQIRSQGIDTMETRQVSEHICLSELPFVMRAIGFYPSEEKVGRNQISAGGGLFITSASGKSLWSQPGNMPLFSSK